MWNDDGSNILIGENEVLVFMGWCKCTGEIMLSKER